MPTAQASTGNRPDSRWQKKKSRQLLDLVKRCLIPRIGQWCDAVAGGCSLSCSPRSHRSLLLLGSSQWQRAFTAQLTYAACLHPAGVSHPDEHISPPDALFFFFFSGGDISGQIKHLASALIPPQATYGRVSSSHEVSGTMMIINNKMKISKKKKKKGNSEDTCAEISPTAGACHRPPSASQKTSQPTSQPAPSSHPLSTSCCCEMCVSRSRLTLPIVCT